LKYLNTPKTNGKDSDYLLKKIIFASTFRIVYEKDFMDSGFVAPDAWLAQKNCLIDRK